MKKYIYNSQAFSIKDQERVLKDGHTFFKCNCKAGSDALVFLYGIEEVACEACGRSRNFNKFYNLKVNNPKGFIQVTL